MMIASALALYGGENITFETDMTNPVYTVVDNSSNLEGLNVTFEDGNITISLALNYEPDNYTIIFFDNITYEVEKIIRRGGGTRTRTEYVDRNVTVYVPQYIEEEVIVETIKLKDCEECINTPDTPEPESDVKSVLIILTIIGIVLVGLLIYMLYRNTRD